MAALGKCGNFVSNPTATVIAVNYGQSFINLGIPTISIDGSGAIWVGTSTSGSGFQLVKIFGVATPTVAPLSSGISNNTLGVAP